mmetsp:Transcript_67180/g.111242  ORF Transcript_67180/g.111242 Transcript_67180/m.111242 type:complete len:87 (+) Transcript_67180:44-304(+)
MQGRGCNRGCKARDARGAAPVSAPWPLQGGRPQAWNFRGELHASSCHGMHDFAQSLDPVGERNPVLQEDTAPMMLSCNCLTMLRRG